MSEQTVTAAEPDTDQAEPNPLVAICEQLERLGIVEVVVHYDGSGDSGQVNYLVPKFFNFELAKAVFPQFFKEEDFELPENFREKISDFAWDDVLCHTDYDGFWNGDGGFGTVTINVLERKATLEHSDYETVAHERDPVEFAAGDFEDDVPATE